MPDFVGWLADPATTQKAIDLADYVARIAASLVVAWGAVEKIVKPLIEWRSKLRIAREAALTLKVRDVLKPELDDLKRLGVCTDRLEVVLARQTEIFTDVDKLLTIVEDNRERLNETAGLLDAMGLTSDRRTDTVERQAFDVQIQQLRDRQRDRRRQEREVAAAAESANTSKPEAKT